MAGDEGDEADFRARSLEGGAFGGVESLESVVARFRINVWLEQGNFRRETGARENESGRDATEAGQSVGSVLFRVQRAIWAFQLADGGVAIDCHDEEIAQGGGLMQVGEMTAVEEVEAAIGEDKFPARGSRRFTESEEVIHA